MIIGFIVGSFLGAHFVQYLPAAVLKKVFGVALILMWVEDGIFEINVGAGFPSPLILGRGDLAPTVLL